MWLVRPVGPEDLNDVLALAESREVHVSSTLPASQDLLVARLALARNSFLNADRSGSHRFLFALEDTDTGRLKGVAGIDARAGNGQPFYNYRRDALIHASHELGVSRRVDVLYPSHALTDLSQLCSFVIATGLADGDAIELLSRARVLFIADHRESFTSELIAELPGAQSADGAVPFWDSLGRHFFDMDFATADHYSATHSKTFIAELMPHNPIYVSLLSEAAREAVGQCHRLSGPTCDLLKREGLAATDYVDIFDGGPVLKAHTNRLRTLVTSHRVELHGEESNQGDLCLIAGGQGENFRCTLAPVSTSLQGAARVRPGVWQTLGLSPGDPVRIAAL
jgi:arginine N-succinyltransferase